MMKERDLQRQWCMHTLSRCVCVCMCLCVHVWCMPIRWNFIPDQENVEVRVARIFNTYGPKMHMFDGKGDGR